MLAHWHGQTWNGSEFGRAFGVGHTTVRRYLDLLSSLFVVRQLPPWFENIAKRQVRSPKVYVADPGILHTLLGVDSRDALLSHPKVGASWEGFIVSQVIARLGAEPEQCYHWSTHSGAALDLLVVAGRAGTASRSNGPRRPGSHRLCGRVLRPWGSRASTSFMLVTGSTHWRTASGPCRVPR